MELKDIRYKDMDWIDLDRDWDKRRDIVNTAMNIRVP